MRYNIVHDMPGRIRVRAGSLAFDINQSYSIEYVLGKYQFIESVKSCHTTGSILIQYVKGKKAEVLKAIKEIDVKNLPEIKDTTGTKEIDLEFQNTLVNMVGNRLISKIFFPFWLRKVLTLYRSVKFIKEGLGCLLKGKITVEVLDAASITAAITQKEYSTAGSIMFLLRISELLEDYTKKKSRNELTNSLAINLDSVWIADGSIERQIPLAQLKVGDTVVVHTGSMIPVDGIIVDGEGMINQSTMTGEPLAVKKEVEDVVYAGTVVEEGSIRVQVKSLTNDSRINKIIELIDDSEKAKADIQGRAERLADGIVPFSLLGAGLTYAITRNVTKALSILLVDYSCAIKLSTPISVISAMREASSHKVMIKGGKYLETLSEADTIVFDKTGTLTVASPKVAKVIPFEGFERDYVLKTAACLEEHFPHSVARAIVKKAAEEGMDHKEEHAEVQYVVAHGIASSINEEKAIIGSYHFVFEDEGVNLLEEQEELIDKEGEGYSIIYLAVGGKPAGFICIEDPVRKESKELIEALRETGIKNVIMLTGDGEKTAAKVCAELNIDRYYSQVLPEDKARIIEDLKKEGHTVVMVGDGVNDSPALAAANVSIAMKDGSDIAREVADISLMNSDLLQIVTARILGQKLMEKISRNYRRIVVINTSLIAFGLLGYIQPTTSAIIHNLSTMVISAGSMKRCLE